MGHSERDFLVVADDSNEQGHGWGAWLKASPMKGKNQEGMEVRELITGKRLNFTSKTEAAYKPETVTFHHRKEKGLVEKEGDVHLIEGQCRGQSSRRDGEVGTEECEEAGTEEREEVGDGNMNTISVRRTKTCVIREEVVQEDMKVIEMEGKRGVGEEGGGVPPQFNMGKMTGERRKITSVKKRGTAKNTQKLQLRCNNDTPTRSKDEPLMKEIMGEKRKAPDEMEMDGGDAVMDEFVKKKSKTQQCTMMDVPTEKVAVVGKSPSRDQQ
uniref:Uncharacterized protein n=1 Tax=Chenopodium quinoa TaxID=63459 RepID=A0A803MPS2_CHEQI